MAETNIDFDNIPTSIRQPVFIVNIIRAMR